jgi:HK97 family phage portal protein
MATMRLARHGVGHFVSQVAGQLIRKTFNSLYSVTQGWANWGWGILESFTGAWQQNVVATDPRQTILAFSAVFACITGIASDIAKLRIKLDERDNGTGIWEEITEFDTHGNKFALVWLLLLKKPNHFQTRIQFVEQWLLSKLQWGNTYVLKQRDATGTIVALYVLCPQRVTPAVADDGSVWYQLQADFLSQLPESPLLPVPASEIIHDRMNCFFHPLVGISPLFACAVSATMGNKIQASSTNFFLNAARPGGLLLAPGKISNQSALELKTYWDTNFSGANSGKVAVLGDGLRFEPMMPAAGQAQISQLIEQLKFSVEDVARAFHYPLFKLQVPMAGFTWQNVEQLNVVYYSDCLQSYIEAFELILDEGIELDPEFATEFDLDGLLRMDTLALVESIDKGVSAGVVTPNEGRFKLNLQPKLGGESPYLQQQNYSLEALAKRDAQQNPFATNGTTPTTPAIPPTDTPSEQKLLAAPKSLDDEEIGMLEFINLAKPDWFYSAGGHGT